MAETYFDDLETRSADARAAAPLEALNAQLARVGHAPVADLAGVAARAVVPHSALS